MLSGIFVWWAETCQLTSFTEGMLPRVTDGPLLGSAVPFAQGLDIRVAKPRHGRSHEQPCVWIYFAKFVAPISFYVMLSLVSGTDEVVDCSLIVGWLGAEVTLGFYSVRATTLRTLGTASQRSPLEQVRRPGRGLWR